jgi:hypothetical protein
MKIRPAGLSDYPAIAEVTRRNGIPPRSREKWEYLWTEFPLRERFADLPIGWVLEDDAGQIAGTLSNVYSAYEWNGRPLRGAIAGNWAVDEKHRGSSLGLSAKFFSQPADVLINGSLSRVAAQLMPFFKASRVPSPGFDRHFLWVADHTAFANSVLRQKAAPAAGILMYPAGLALWLRDFLFRSGQGRQSPDIVHLDSFDERFDTFWDQLRRQPDRLLAVRSRPMLAWRFKYQLAENQLRILALHKHGQMSGYVILARVHRENLALRQYRIIDLQVLEENEESVRQLLLAAIRLTRVEGLHLLEWIGFNERKRSAAKRLHPLEYRNPVWQFYYKAANRELAAPLGNPNSWDVCPLDRD